LQLTQTGRELATICAPDADWDYMNHVIEKWQKEGLTVVEIMTDNAADCK